MIHSRTVRLHYPPLLLCLTIACYVILTGGFSTAHAANLLWDATSGGANPGAQDGSGTWAHLGPNWQNVDNGANDRSFRNGDAVTFGAGSGVAGTITLSGAVSTNSITFNAPGSGNYVISGGTGITMATGTIVANANATISSVLVGSGTLTKGGTATLTLTGANTYSGTTTVNRGTLELSGTGALTQTAGITLEMGGTLKLRNTSSANSGDRLRNAAPLSLLGGTLWLADDGSNAAYAETVGPTTAVAGASTLSTVSSSAGSTNLRLAQVSRNEGATLNFTGTNLGVTAKNRILVTGTSSPNLGLISGWATVDNEFAKYDRTNGVTALTAADYVTTGEAAWNSGVNAKITGDTTLTNDRRVGSLNIAAAGTTTVNLNGETLRVESGGILVSGSSAVTISNGTLTDGTAGEVILHQNSTAELDITASIADNGTNSTALVKSGAGTATLSGANSFTGGVFVNAGTLKVNHAAAINAANTLAVEGGTLDLNGNDVTVASLSSQTTYTDDDITYANKSGVITNTNATGGAKTLTAGADNSSTTFSGQLGANLNFTKTGTGTFTLNQSNASYEGIVTVAQGTLATGSATALGATGAASKTVVQEGATLDITLGISHDEVLEVAGHGVNGRGAIVSDSHSTHTFGNMTLTGHTTLRVDADGYQFDGTLAGGGFNLTKVGVQDLLLSGANVQDLGDVHIKLSTVTWSGSADLGVSTNTLYVNSGATALGATAQFTNKNSDAKRITLAGGTLRRNGTASGAAGQVLDVVGGLKLAVGKSSIVHTNSQLVFQLNAIQRDVGATLNVDNNATLATTDTRNDAGGILGGFITVGATDWAKNNTNADDGAIVAYTGYAANDFSSATNNVNVTGTQSATDATVHSLRFSQAGTTLNLTGTNTVVSGGILFTAGAYSTIAGGTLRGSAGGDLVIIQGSGARVEISSTIADNTSATALTKSGVGILELTGNNTYTGGTFLVGGVVEVNSIADSGVSNLGHSTGGTNNMITFNGSGTTLSLLDTGTDSATARNVMIMSDSRAVLRVGAGRQLELSGVISSEALLTGEGDSHMTTFQKTYEGTLIFSGTESNTFTGGVEVSDGTLRLNKSGGATAIAGEVSVSGFLVLDQSNQIADTSIMSVGNGAFHLEGHSETIGGLIGSLGSGSVRNFAAANGSIETNVAAGKSYTFAGQIQDGSGGTLSYTKSGAGTQILTGSNTYTGTTTLKEGTLQLGNGGTTGTLATATNVVFDGGRLAINHSDDRTFSNAMSGTGTFAITGTGNITIDSANTHAGTTEVLSGALYVRNTTGSATGSTAVIVSGTGVLSGTGRIAGHTTVRDGGQLIAGNVPFLSAIGTLTLGGLTVNRQAFSRPSILLELGSNGSFIFNDAAGISANMGDLTTYFATKIDEYENESGVHDRLNVEGTMSLEGGATVELRTLSYQLKAGDVMDLLDFMEMNRLNAPGDRPWSAFQDLYLPTLGAGLSYDLSLFESNGIVVVIGAAPEPGRAMLLMFGLAGMVLRRRRQIS
ncbi:autotransporter-associated beta strand repeat-containing protein [Roseimicrobium sp. ORNL1]|uniref:beta strand repeat-containing protein n=1 Tax=Roseimicrobium sp. ORNL1 TaxID=2711231 RepID=UPI0013E179ED|nr:autotransporter-associated beta strand repeat-containing protein [Roseimicrobium sp. ORNL1]QIF01738.1 PEP-CTERM sorting domain-containing protein [Roseimicrobium sp. ORNL1]